MRVFLTVWLNLRVVHRAPAGKITCSFSHFQKAAETSGFSCHRGAQKKRAAQQVVLSNLSCWSCLHEVIQEFIALLRFLSRDESGLSGEDWSLAFVKLISPNAFFLIIVLQIFIRLLSVNNSLLWLKRTIDHLIDLLWPRTLADIWIWTHIYKFLSMQSMQSHPALQSCAVKKGICAQKQSFF